MSCYLFITISFEKNFLLNYVSMQIGCSRERDHVCSLSLFLLLFNKKLKSLFYNWNTTKISLYLTFHITVLSLGSTTHSIYVCTLKTTLNINSNCNIHISTIWNYDYTRLIKLNFKIYKKNLLILWNLLSDLCTNKHLDSFQFKTIFTCDLCQPDDLLM